MKRMILTAFALIAVSCGLAACEISNAKDAASQAYDKLCQNEPQIYAALLLFKPNPSIKVQAAHDGIVQLCLSKPTNIVAGLVTLTAMYKTVYDDLHPKPS